MTESFQVAVRTLCEFTAKQGDLDARFTPSPSALEGQAGHRIIAARRDACYVKEISLCGDHGLLQVRGRADGYDPRINRLEEFKTYRGELARMPENHRALHWAQLRVYGCLFCRRKGLRELNLALVYFDVTSEQETILEQTLSAEALEEHFAACCEAFMSWAEGEAAHHSRRNQALEGLQFPFARFHSGQRQLAETIYRCARGGGALLAQAPTGIGKTLGSLFPALKAMASADLDRVFYLVAKTSGRELAVQALRRLRCAQAPLPLRVLELVARSKVCEYPGAACSAAECPLARGFYDRLPAARAAAVTEAFMDRATVRAIAHKHQVCPYYLSQELARWSDVIVGDYNYYFDRSAMLYGWTIGQEWRVCILVDEAHNLVERARRMYTATLDDNLLSVVRSQAPPPLRAAIEQLSRTWQATLAAQIEAHQVYAELPAPLLNALEHWVSAVSERLDGPAEAVGVAPLELFFEALSFCRLAQDFDASSTFEIIKSAAGDSLCLRNLVPGRFLAPRFAAARSAVLFSATLAPFEFFRDVLGLPPSTSFLDVGSPFRAEQLDVRLVRTISTRWRDRERSLEPIARLLERQLRARPGNYLAFFSSFDYLERAAHLVTSRCPQLPVWKQHAGMAEADRETFLRRFVPDGCGIGFAVLGGAFAEGVDLPGSRLIGAFVVTLGLPQVNVLNEEMQRRMQSQFGSGYEYTYLYPGIHKVIQAAGRVIRTLEDQGVLYLIDDRFGQSRVRRLLPQWWSCLS